MSNISQRISYFIAVFFTIFSIFAIVSGTQAANITVSPPKFEFDVEPGQVTEGTISITNGDTQDLELSSSVADFTAVGESGRANFIEHEDSSAFALSSWISLPENLVTVPAGGKLAIPFNITVPEHAEAGGHFGTIFFSPLTPETGEVSVKQKVGVLLLVRVAGEVVESGELTVFDTYATTIDADEVAASAPKRFYQHLPVSFAVRFTNTGNVHTKPLGQITLINMFGKQLARVGEEVLQTPSGAITGKQIVDYLPLNAEGGNVLPNSSRVFISPWKGYGSQVLNEAGDRINVFRGIGFGRYTARLSLVYGSAEVQEREIHFWVIPWMIIVPGIAGLLLLALLLRYWRATSRERLKERLRAEIEQENPHQSGYTDEYTDTTVDYEDPEDIQ